MIVFRVGGVGGHGDAAGAQDRKIDDRPFGAVFTDQQDAIAGLQAFGAQRFGEAMYAVPHHRPGPGTIAAVDLAPKEWFLTAARR